MKRVILLFVLLFSFTACEKVDTVKEVNTDFVDNFEMVWELVNERYCYLGYKDIDWQGVYEEMLPRVVTAEDEFEFFAILTDVIDVLRDGHVSLISDFARHSSDYAVEPNGDPSPTDFLGLSAVSDYVEELYRTRNGFSFGSIEKEGKELAYLYYPDFSTSLEDVDMQYIAPVVERADGLILDIRDNPGGSAILGMSLAGHFFTEKTLVGHSASKSGSGYDDFTEPHEIYVTPSEEHNWTEIPTMLLTNRGVYSTANLVTSALKHAPNVTQVGGRSGGGGGMPCNYYLPNGWILIMPSNVLYDADIQHIENGIEPDVEVHISVDDEITKKDTIIEKAIELLLN